LPNSTRFVEDRERVLTGARILKRLLTIARV
jgi:hypothetical protein